MVSLRCKLLVKCKLEELGVRYNCIELGEIDVPEQIPKDKIDQFKSELLQSGLVLMENTKAVLVEKIKAVVIEMVHYADDFPDTKHSIHISEKLQHN
ncbi:MAG: AraC family transcriptional regulator, partial [Sphingobacteriaceae bacterium]